MRGLKSALPRLRELCVRTRGRRGRSAALVERLRTENSTRWRSGTKSRFARPEIRLGQHRHRWRRQRARRISTCGGGMSSAVWLRQSEAMAHKSPELGAFPLVKPHHRTPTGPSCRNPATQAPRAKANSVSAATCRALKSATRCNNIPICPRRSFMIRVVPAHHLFR